jgi:hypothetical protein
VQPGPEEKKNIEKASVSVASSRTFTGKQIRLSPTVKLGGAVLEEDVDYVLLYGENKSIGPGTVTITGTGEYYGTKKVGFDILPEKVSFSSVKVKKSSVVLQWKKAKSAQKITGYTVSYRLKGGEWTQKTLGRDTVKWTAKSLKKGRAYEFKIRAYKAVAGKSYLSGWSPVRSCKVK